MGLPLSGILEWLNEMTNVLVDECNATDNVQQMPPGAIMRSSATTGIQLLLGSVRNIFVTPTMDPGGDAKKYPDPALIEGGE